MKPIKYMWNMAKITLSFSILIQTLHIMIWIKFLHPKLICFPVLPSILKPAVPWFWNYEKHPALHCNYVLSKFSFLTLFIAAESGLAFYLILDGRHGWLVWWVLVSYSYEVWYGYGLPFLLHKQTCNETKFKIIPKHVFNLDFTTMERPRPLI